MNVFGKLIHWAKYGELIRYPKLKAFEPASAMKRLQEYRKEYHRTREWRLLMTLCNVVPILVTSFLLMYFPNHWMGLVPMSILAILVFVIFYVLHRRFNRFVEAKVAEDLKGVRWKTCIKCSYDLRASKDHCPECGASVYVLPPAKAT